MNWNRIEGEWKQRRGKAEHHWGKTMNDELAAIAGKRDQLVGILQEKYGVAKEEAKQQIDEFRDIVKQLKKSNSRLMRLKRSSPERKNASTRKPEGAKKTLKKRRNIKGVNAHPQS